MRKTRQDWNSRKVVLESEPAKYEVTEYIATTYKCPKCKQT
ncbi:MAG: hypothetical protein HFH85_10765 [Lachnospiraceae bacterium]|nr:hypothetical protein [Lachnospiraceae bacterium]